MLCSLISPDSELILKAKCLGDWEMVAMEVQTNLWQLSKETSIMCWPDLGSCVGASLRLTNNQTLAPRLLPWACVVCQKSKLWLRGVD